MQLYLYLEMPEKHTSQLDSMSISLYISNSTEFQYKHCGALIQPGHDWILPKQISSFARPSPRGGDLLSAPHRWTVARRTEEMLH